MPQPRIRRPAPRRRRGVEANFQTALIMLGFVFAVIAPALGVFVLGQLILTMVPIGTLAACFIGVVFAEIIAVAAVALIVKVR